jgi:hypothetical protein
MAAVKEQHEKYEKFLGGVFFFPPLHLQKLNGGSAER